MNHFPVFNLPLEYINRVCRVCLTEQKLLIPIYEINFTHNLNPQGSIENVALSEVFLKYCNVMVHVCDKKPQKICESCMNAMCTAYNFFELFRKSNTLLNQILKKHEDERRQKAAEERKTAFLMKYSRTPKPTNVLGILPPTMKQLVVDTVQKNGASASCPVAYVESFNKDILDNNVSVRDNKIDAEITERSDSTEIVHSDDQKVSLIKPDHLIYTQYPKQEETLMIRPKRIGTPPCFYFDPSGSLKDHSYALNEKRFLRIQERRLRVKRPPKPKKAKPIKISRQELIAKQKQFEQANPSKPKRIKISRQELRARQKKFEQEHDIFKCRFCTKTFQGMAKVLEHLEVEHPSTQRCILCSKIVKRKDFMMYHVAAHSKHGLVCRMCRLYFDDKESLDRHKAETDHSALLTCKLCNMTFSCQSKMKSHMGGVHEHDDKFKYQCSQCGRVVKYLNNLKRHERTHNVNVKKKNRDFLCQICAKLFFSKNHLDVHVKFVHEGHLRVYNKKYPTNRHNSKSTEHQKKKTFQCEMCSRTFTSNHAFFKHCISHPDYKSVKCPFCEGVFENAESYIRHRKLEHRSHVCHICKRGFPNKPLLKMHVATHNKTFRCDICSFETTVRQQLTCHRRIHTGERPFQCEKCGNAFKQNSQLNQHIQSMHIQKNHKCKLCGKAFGWSYSLKAHMRCHTGKRPFACPYCEKKYRDTVSRHKHVKRDHPEKMTDFLAFKRELQENENKLLLLEDI